MAKRILLAVFVLTALGLALVPSPAPAPVKRAPLEATFKQVILNTPPLDTGQELLVSAEDFFPLFAASAEWYKNRAILKGSRVADVDAGSFEVRIDGNLRLLETAPCLVEDKFYIPLNLALEAMGAPTYNSQAGAGSIQLPPIQSREGLHFRYYPVYDLQARYDPASGRLQGELLLAYQNPFLEPLSKLYFNLPAKAAYGRGADLKINRVLINDQPVVVNISGSSMEVPLPQSLASQKTISLAVSFTTLVPEGATRLGRAEDTSMLAGWYPILAPSGDSCWVGVAAVPYGEPYFADAAYYRVNLILPADCQVLASSRMTGRRQLDDWTIWSFDSEHPLREFAFTVDSSWQFNTAQVGSVQLVLASRGEAVETTIETATRALNFFQKTYGPYPYSYLNIAFAPLENLAGMEYPGLILLSTHKPYSPSVVVHEVAHQWWYNLVGNDSVRAAWVDEGLAEYSTLLFYRIHDPAFYRAKLAGLEKLSKLTDDPFDLPLEKYASEQAYRQAVYNRGAMFWLQVEAVAGTSRLQEALAYIQRYYRYEIISPRSLMVILAYYGGITINDFTPFFGTNNAIKRLI